VQALQDDDWADCLDETACGSIASRVRPVGMIGNRMRRPRRRITRQQQNGVKRKVEAAAGAR
jgi:hypothetical protein